MENEQVCQMPNRLEIYYNESTKLAYLSRCCFTRPFKVLTYKELLDVDNLFSLSTKDFIKDTFGYSSKNNPACLSFDYYDKSCQDLFLEIKALNKS